MRGGGRAKENVDRKKMAITKTMACVLIDAYLSFSATKGVVMITV